MRTVKNVAGKHERGAAAREQLRARLKKFGGGRRAGAVGLPELAALAVSALLLLAALCAYFLLLAPARARLARLGLEREQLQRRLQQSNENAVRHQSAGQLAGSILGSLETFENALGYREESSRAVVEELNEKTRRNGLARAQFSFSYQDELAPGQQPAAQPAQVSAGGRFNRRQTVFPAIDISLTVEGPYAALRRFIRDVETSGRLIVINGVQLEGINESGAGRAGEGGARGTLVSLRLDMSAYFHRAGRATAGPAGSSQTAR